MYIPQAFAETDLGVLHEFMRQHSFATVVTQQEGRPFASHLPLVVDGSVGEHGMLIGHLARNNPQWQDFASGAEVLVMFHGPHAYVSPSWYEASPMAVPTWNYTVVHAYGVARILPEEGLEKTLYQLVDDNEKLFSPPWRLELTQAMRDGMLKAIVGFEIRLHRVEGKFKLSQNRSQQDRLNVIANLMSSAHGRDVAHNMIQTLEGE